jgi:hypothetical protein
MFYCHDDTTIMLLKAAYLSTSVTKEHSKGSLQVMISLASQKISCKVNRKDISPSWIIP